MDHPKIIASLNLVIAALNLVGGALFFGRGPAGGWLSVGAATVLVIGVLALLAAIGLLRGRGWGRAPAFAVAVAVLIVIPVGTAYGIYAMVMLRGPAVKRSLT